MESKTSEPKPMRKRLALVPVTYLTLLLAIAVAFHSDGPFDLFGLPVPLTVIWFGALGGVVDSLQGMFFYNKKWKDEFTLWHYFSGVVGASYGLASYLFLTVIVKSAVANPGDVNAPVFALGAFALGYGQSQFHAMMTQVFAILFHPSKAQTKGDPSQSDRSSSS